MFSLPSNTQLPSAPVELLSGKQQRTVCNMQPLGLYFYILKHLYTHSVGSNPTSTRQTIVEVKSKHSAEHGISLNYLD